MIFIFFFFFYKLKIKSCKEMIGVTVFVLKGHFLGRFVCHAPLMGVL